MNIEVIEERYKEQKEKAELAKYIEELMLADWIREVNKRMSIYSINESFFAAAREKEEFAVKYLKEKIAEDFFYPFGYAEKDLSFDKIVASAYCDYYGIYIDFPEEREVQLIFPMYKNINEHNFFSTKGKYKCLVRNHKESIVWDTIAASYDTAEVAKAIYNYFNERGK